MSAIYPPVIIVSALLGILAGGLAVYVENRPDRRTLLCDKAFATILGGTDPRDVRVADFLVKRFGCRIVFRF
jgi:hypothetical protein